MPRHSPLSSPISSLEVLYNHTVMSYFKPMPPKLGGCWTCTHWHGETTDQGRRPYCSSARIDQVVTCCPVTLDTDIWNMMT